MAASNLIKTLLCYSEIFHMALIPTKSWQSAKFLRSGFDPFSTGDYGIVFRWSIFEEIRENAV
jgi:hypothetical protein